MQFMFSLYAFEIQGKKKNQKAKETCILDDFWKQWQYYYILWVKESFCFQNSHSLIKLHPKCKTIKIYYEEIPLYRQWIKQDIKF